ncbi:MAG: hypothetical protein ACKO72_05725 [Actinomycetes bacterium]
MLWLTSLPTGVVFVAFIVVMGGVAAIAHHLMITRISEERRAGMAKTATVYITELGTLFAILTGFLISAEYSIYRQAQTAIAQETSAGTNLAYSTRPLPAVDISQIQDRAAAYIDSIQREDWQALKRGDLPAGETFDRMRDLQGAAYLLTAREYTPASTEWELRQAVDDLIARRKERLAIGTLTMPGLMFALSVVAGLALIINAVMVSLREGRYAALVAVTIVVIVALDLALIIALSAPFRGGFIVSSAPLEILQDELRHGRYLPWVG